MGEDTDLYLVLGLTRSASQSEIVRAFRRQLRRHHPDTRTTDGTSGDQDEQLQRILTAYAVLRDPIRRAEYDRHPPTPTGETIRVRFRHKYPRQPSTPPTPPLWAGPVRRLD